MSQHNPFSHYSAPERAFVNAYCRTLLIGYATSILSGVVALRAANTLMDKDGVVLPVSTPADFIQYCLWKGWLIGDLQRFEVTELGYQEADDMLRARHGLFPYKE